ncbi:glycosyltransferase family 9 protein [Thermocrinis sp.]
MRTILLYRRGGLGDTLLTFPILEIFKRRGFYVIAVGNTDYYKIAKAVGWADEVFYEKPGKNFDIEISIGLDGIDPFPKKRIWIVEHYLKTLGLWGNYFSTYLPLEGYDLSPMKDKVVLHPSSGSKKKNPPLELFMRIEKFFHSFGYECIYLVGEADSWLKDHVKNYVELLDPLEMAKHIKSARLFVGNDSGVSHLSSYLGIPTFVFYGPTDWRIWKPIGEKVFPISLELECSPCFPNTCSDKPCFNVDRLFDLFKRHEPVRF